ncbi:REP element-mobilizing transposase RayT [Keratinibaculum paraultunense]|uniref:REP element-mobilizing transposase RayT n=1 Tax=Keratinibaculum paraultunense TaxID=1278232 RepID=A0A4R3KZF9_9FIRM|nr:transposase [Keratinibaculum paraultunense]QQY79955.1 transposase [Keratinibaculum paraultunense]TCS91724.1 REP element-mobilizing transposase RayT [Keratinibaculum paraultunense]
MGRKPRIEYYGAIYHIIQRGNNREAIFKRDEDKVCLLKILSETKEMYDFKIFAYVVMNNHYHFLIQTLNIPISKIMHQINTRYAKYYNYSTGNTGPVFEDRYKGILVQDESYLLALIRYIHNNPVAAKICPIMEQYKWSSDMFYRMNMDNMVDIDEFLNILSPNRVEAIRIYIKLMDKDDLEYQILEEIYEKNDVIGNEKFRKSLEGTMEVLSLDEILKKVCPTPVEYDLIKAGSRKRYLSKYKREYIVWGREEGYSYSAIGSFIGITSAAARNLVEEGD